MRLIEIDKVKESQPPKNQRLKSKKYQILYITQHTEQGPYGANFSQHNVSEEVWLLPINKARVFFLFCNCGNFCSNKATMDDMFLCK